MILEILTASILNVTPLPVPHTEYIMEPINGTIIKPTFKQKHPKWYKVGRKARTVCIFIKPIADVVGDVFLILR